MAYGYHPFGHGDWQGRVAPYCCTYVGEIITWGFTTTE